MPQIEITNVEKTYGAGSPRALTVLKNVSFTVEKGEIIGIVGPSGAGKSTLLNIAGLLERPSQGSVKFDGFDPFSLSPERLADFRNIRVGFVFQLHHLLPEFTALENVMLPLMISGKTRKEASAAAKEILGQLGLAERLTHRPTELSGGEQQRIALARAAVNHPNVILADEPTGNLDRETGEKVFDLLLDLNASLKITLLVVTHSVELASKMQRVLRLEDGKLVHG